MGHDGAKSDTQQQTQYADYPQGTCSVQRYHFHSSLVSMRRAAQVSWGSIVLDSVTM
jgi:hypothetical protein